MSDPSDKTSVWQLPVFENNDTPFRRPNRLTPTTESTSQEEVAAKLPTAEEISNIQSAAREEGRKLGYEEGMVQAQRQMSEWGVNLDNLLNSLANPLAQQEQQVSEDLADLAMSVTRHIIRRETKQDPTQVIAVVREAINLLPSTQRDIVVRLHPDDANLIRKIYSLDEQQKSSWSITDDPSVSRGGCIVLSELSKVDASLEKRISSIFTHIFGDQRESGEQEFNEHVSDERDLVERRTDENLRAEEKHGVEKKQLRADAIEPTTMDEPSTSNPENPVKEADAQTKADLAPQTRQTKAPQPPMTSENTVNPQPAEAPTPKAEDE